jgi:hypothetical protein
MPPTAYRLIKPLAAERPSRWDIQARCAIRFPAESVQLPAGTWLLELPPADSNHPHPPITGWPTAGSWPSPNPSPPNWPFS